MMDILRWMFAETTLAVLTWVGTAIGLIGLPAAFAQVRLARKSADSAAKAVWALEDRLALSALGHALSTLDHIRDLVQQNRIDFAAGLFLSWKRSVMEAFHLYGRDRPVWEFEQLKTTLTIIERQLELGRGREAAYIAARLRAALITLYGFIGRHETEMKFPSRREGRRDARD